MAETRFRWLTAEEQRAWRAYLEATQLLFEAIDRQLQRDAGLSHADYEVLVRLSEAKDRRMRMSELADRTSSSRSRLSHAMARLADIGLVRRDACPTDRRGTLAVLTDKGMKRLEAIAPGHVSEVRCSMFDKLTPAQVAQLERIAKTVKAGLECPTTSDRDS